MPSEKHSYCGINAIDRSIVYLVNCGYADRCILHVLNREVLHRRRKQAMLPSPAPPPAAVRPIPRRDCLVLSDWVKRRPDCLVLSRLGGAKSGPDTAEH